jgi:sensor domain DACNV-containing protein
MGLLCLCWYDGFMNPGTPSDRSDSEAPPPELGAANQHAYPSDLAALVLTRWHEATAAGQIDLLPPAASTLTDVLSICYQATLLREEGRPVTFRLSLSEPDAFAPTAGPPAGLHRLVFMRPLPLDQHELRRLAPAVVFSRSLIGATAAGGEARIWGVIHSGPQWLQSVRGGRETEQTIPPVLIVAATGPGRLLVTAGALTLAELRNGTLSGGNVDVFEAQWLRERLSDVGRRTRAAHRRDRERPGESRAVIHSTFGAVLAGHVLRRIVATIRAAQHGGTLIIVPSRRVAELLLDGCYMRVKYGFTDEEPRRRILTLMGHIMNELAKDEAGKVVGWSTYEASPSQQLSQMDEALFEVAHLVADLTRVDGAVIMTDCLEVLGFGVEIAGELPEVRRVARAHDLEGIEREWVRTDRVGTRHGSAYRLCRAVRDALALVVSQDGGLRFIRWHDDGVTYWEQIATGLWEL